MADDIINCRKMIELMDIGQYITKNNGLLQNELFVISYTDHYLEYKNIGDNLKFVSY